MIIFKELNNKTITMRIIYPHTDHTIYYSTLEINDCNDL